MDFYDVLCTKLLQTSQTSCLWGLGTVALFHILISMGKAGESHTSLSFAPNANMQADGCWSSDSIRLQLLGLTPATRIYCKEVLLSCR